MYNFLSGLLLLVIACSTQDINHAVNDMETIELTPPDKTGDLSIEETLQNRRSVRDFSDAALTLDEIGQLAWAAQGITDETHGYKTAPSAGATYPIELYFIVAEVVDISNGVYRYNNRNHTLEQIIDQDQRDQLYRVALEQDAIIQAPVVLVITGVLERTEQRYGERALRFMHMESGHVAQNVYLQSVALTIGTVVIGAFDDSGVSEVLDLDDGEHPLYIMPLGRPN